MRIILFLVSVAFATPLPVPVEMVGRVEFWIRVFGELSSHKKVIHHRWFPDCVFMTLDFTVEAALLSKPDLQKLIDETERETISKIKASLKRIAQNQPTLSLFDLRIKEVVDQCLRKKRKNVILWTLEEDLIRSQTGVMEKTRDAVKKGGRYLNFIQNVFRSYGIPDDIKYLPIVESSFNVNATSKAGAVGMWQFMPQTAKNYGLVVNKYIDERRDPFKSTEAAARYLREAYSVFKSWPHALISYNHGIMGLKSKLDQSGIGLDLVKLIENPFNRILGFASTNFYPSFLATVYIAKNYKSFFGDFEPDPPLNVTKHYLTKSLSIYSLVTATGISKDKLLELNPQFNPIIRDGKQAIPAHTLVYLPPKTQVDYSKIPTIKKKSNK